MAEVRSREPLVILVVGTDDEAIAKGVEAVEAAGNRALACHAPGQPAFPCNAFIDDATCPLDDGFDFAVTVRSVASTTPTISEIGAVCALRDGKRLVVAGANEPNPFGALTSATIDCDPFVALEKAAPSAEDPLTYTPTDLRRW